LAIGYFSKQSVKPDGDAEAGEGGDQNTDRPDGPGPQVSQILRPYLAIEVYFIRSIKVIHFLGF